MARLIVSRETQADLDEILAYLASLAGKSVALRYGERIRAAFRYLMDFPATGAMRPWLDADLRIWVVAHYVVFYRFDIDDDMSEWCGFYTAGATSLSACSRSEANGGRNCGQKRW